jgi:hypothetical protein
MKFHLFSGVKNKLHDLSPCKSLGVMIVFIIMKEIGVNIGHTLGLKLIIIMCLVSKGCTKGSLCHFQPFEGQIKCPVYLLQTHLKVHSVSRKYLMH